MKSEKLNSWLGLVANFGVVIGFALLIYELRESQKLVETETAVARLNLIQAAEMEFATSDYLPPIRVKALTQGVGALSAVELSRLKMWEQSVRRRMESQYIQFQQGYLDPETANRAINAAAEMLPLWEELGFELSDRDFHEAIRKAAGR